MSPSGSKDQTEAAYKVLIMDKFARELVAPLLRVQDLRKHGVTLHLALESDRQPIPDVPAIYLMQPTPFNIERVASDASSSLYESMHLNFTSLLPTRVMEQLATAVVKTGHAGKITKLFDQYLSFVALEPGLFSLGLPDTYLQLNDPTANDNQIEAAVSTIVEGLFSACVTLGVVPIIRCPRGGSAEHVGSQLDSKLRDSLRARNNLFSEALGGVAGLSASSHQRPLLCLFDRNFDLSSALQQPWTYKPMVHDVLGLKLNKVLVSEGGGAAGSSTTNPNQPRAKKTAYDVDEKDFFWEACGSYPFPRVAEEVEGQLKGYRSAVEDINRKTTAGPQEGVPYDPEDLVAKNTQSLIHAVSSLPELQERKKVLDKHTNLATTLLVEIKARALDQYHLLAEDLLGGRGDRSSVLKLIQGPKGTLEDKTRLVLLWLITQEGLPSEQDLGEMESALKSASPPSQPSPPSPDLSPLHYVYNLKRNNLTGHQGQGGKGGGGAGGSGGLGDGGLSSALASQAQLLDWADKTFGQGLSQVAKSVTKTLLATGGGRQAPMTLAVEALAEARAGAPEHEGYAVFDPKLPPNKANPQSLAQSSSSLSSSGGMGGMGGMGGGGGFKEVIVFVIGGGNYLEREQLATWAQKVGPVTRHVTYGSTELLTGGEFLHQLGEVGKRSLSAQGRNY